MSENPSIVSNRLSKAFQDAAGPIRYGFTNDYMFHAVLQNSKPVLKSLICSLLHLQPGDVRSIVITNPILPGESFDSKEFVLDVEIVLNGNVLLNLEMQVINHHNWTDRSLSYLCRRFDQLRQGEDYANCRPAIHIGFLDFAPFPECPEFYATHKLLNVKNLHLYSDKFTLSVVDLSHIDLATDEDRAYGIDRWARLFKATTWEELKMIAENDSAMTDASECLFMLNTDNLAQKRAQARREYIIHEQAVQKKIEELTAKNKDLSAENKDLSAEIKDLSAEIKNLFAKNKDLSAEIKDLSAIIKSLQAELATYKNAGNSTSPAGDHT